MSSKISVVICSKNEEEVIEGCIASVDWADEVILVDDYSEDETVKIAKKYKAQVYLHRWEGFSVQKNFGFTKTSGDWVLFLDADERVRGDLKDEILREVNKPDNHYSSYEIPRLNNFLGKDMLFGGWYPDYQKRLVKANAFKKWEGKLHEKIVSTGKMGKLTSNLYHLAHRSLRGMVEKSIQYTDFEAKEMLLKNHPKMVWWRFFRPMFGEFWARLIKKSGWRDGVVGWIEAIYQAFNKFLIYARLWELQVKGGK